MKILASTFFAALLLALPGTAGIITYTASLSGPAESPANASTGTGAATVILDTVAQTLEVQVSFSGLTGTTTASHIHCCTAVAGAGAAGVATQTPSFTGFPLGVMAGTYDHLFDLTLSSTYNSAFVTAQGGLSQAEAALLAGLAGGTTYLNIHTNAFPGGEIRGFLTAQTPEPATFGLAGAALLVAVLSRRRRV